MWTCNVNVALAAAILLFTCAASPGPVAARAIGPDGKPGEPVNRSGPLSQLPSRGGDHVAAVNAMGDDTWLDLGKPAPDPKWGTPRGRSWTATMAYAPELRAAFLFGEGVHGWWDEQTGRYMDDLWAYDLNAHRWVCVYPGADVKQLDLSLNEHGVEVTKDTGEPIPVAQMVHGYEGTAYDTDRRRFMFMPCPGDYWGPALGGRRLAWLKQKSNARAKDCSPWFYDTHIGKWERRATNAPGPDGGFGDVLLYVPTLKKTFLRTAGTDVWWYDASANRWTKAAPKGPSPPFGIDTTACYDSKRDRIYVGGGEYPVAEGPNALWVYDVKSDTWIDPQPEGQCCGGSNSFNTNKAVMTYDRANDVVVLNLHTAAEDGKSRTGIWVYHPQTNAWEAQPRPFPEGTAWKEVNGFYDPELNVHVYHHAGDSEPDGSIQVYRWKD